MELPDVQSKLTNAAKQALESIIDDYRNEILLSARESATSLTGDLHEISVHDVLEGARKSESSFTKQAPSSLYRILRVYTYLGLLISCIGILWFFAQRYLELLTFEEQMALAVAVSGLIISSLSYILIQYRKHDRVPKIHFEDVSDSQSSDFAISFLRDWQRIELLIRNIISGKYGESRANEPISMMVRMLSRSGRLTTSESKQIKQLLDVRNKIVHEGLQISAAKYDELHSEARRIIYRLSKYK